MRAAILARDPQCRLALAGCTGTSTEADHVLPRFLGGEDTMRNGRGVCSHCHAIQTRAQSTIGLRRQAARGRYPQQRSAGLL